MHSGNNFQIFVIAIFIFLAIFAVLVFSGLLPFGKGLDSGVIATRVVWWSVVPKSEIQDWLSDFQTNNKQFNVVYVEKDPRTLENDLINALADGQGPDLLLSSQDLIFKQAEKFLPLTDTEVSQRYLQDNFVQLAGLLRGPQGTLGLPLVVDPLVLYFNRDLLNGARLALPPKLWSEVEAQNKVLTVADPRGNISQSALALGNFSNLDHAKDILTLLFLQAGNPIVARDERGVEQAKLRDTLGYATPPATRAVAFFNSFSDSANSLYSWNSSLPEARQAFIRGTLAMYFGYASELNRLRQQNPQLNFDVAIVPQPATGQLPKVTVGQMLVLTILKNSRVAAGTKQFISTLLSPTNDQAWATALQLAPARLDLLQTKPRDPFQAVFADSALIARSWPDPDATKTAIIFRDLATGARQGQDLGGLINLAQQSLQALLDSGSTN